MQTFVDEYLAVPLLAYGVLICLMSVYTPESAAARRIIVVMFDLLALRYHLWRITSTLPALEFTFASILVNSFYALELSVAILAWRSRQIVAVTSNRSADVAQNLGWYGHDAPLIDILVPTYNEKASILELTILAAKNQRYPNYRVWVLDDSRRDWLAELCAKLEVEYLRRPDNRHFKAGNLNHALECIREQRGDPDFFAILDADFIVSPDFLLRTLALMKDDRVAVVQTPQHFYNPDPFQYRFDAQNIWPDDQRAFFEFRLPSLDAEGLATCCGTSFLLRAKALREVNGFPVESICEDTLLSIKLRARKWKTIYLNEGLSVGLSPEGLAEFLTQRARWHLGGVQILLYRWSLLGSKLAFAKRARLVESVLRAVLPAIIRLLWLGIPIVYWFTGFTVLRGSGAELLSYAVPLWAARMAFVWVSRGAVLPIVSDAALLLVSPLYVRATLRGLLKSKNQRFVVTAKGISRERLVIHWRSLAWIATFALLLLLGVAYRAFNPQVTLLSSRFLAWNLYSTYNTLAMLLVAAAPCFERPKYRKSERYKTKERISVEFAGVHRSAWLMDLSIGGALLSGVDLGQADRVRVVLSDDLAVEARVARRGAHGAVAVEFEPSYVEKQQLVQRVFCSGRYIVKPRAWSFWACAKAMLRQAAA